MAARVSPARSRYVPFRAEPRAGACQLPLRADDVRLRAAGVREAQQPRDRIERHVVAVMECEHRALHLIQRVDQQLLDAFCQKAALRKVLWAVAHRGDACEDVIGFGLGPLALEPIQPLVTSDAVKPGGEPGGALEGVDMPMRLHEHILREVCGRVAIVGEPKAPAGDALVMPAEQLVERRIAGAAG